MTWPTFADLSGWQTANVDWNSYATTHPIVGLKAAQGAYLNPMPFFGERWAQAGAHGLQRWGYTFLVAGISGVAQAQAFMRVVNGAGGITAADQPVADLEWQPAGMRQWQVGEPGQVLADFSATVEQELGRPGVVYSNRTFLQGYGCTHPAGWQLWDAVYGAAPDSLWDGWPSPTAWQYTFTGTVDGYPDPLDVSYLLTSTAVPMVGDPQLRAPARDTADDGTVHKLQRLLLNAGYHLPVDGVYGDTTLVAVQAFQHAHQLVVDGIVGPLTWSALRAAQPKTPAGAPNVRATHPDQPEVDPDVAHLIQARYQGADGKAYGAGPAYAADGLHKRKIVDPHELGELFASGQLVGPVHLVSQTTIDRLKDA